MKKIQPLPDGTLPIGLTREVAITYTGLLPEQFDELVRVGKLPRPKRRIGVWSRKELDRALGRINPADVWDFLPGNDD